MSYDHLNEVIPGLWIGDIQSARSVETLRTHNIRSILSAMRGRLSIHPTFNQHQILLDDEEDADILAHLVPAISFIQAELEKGRGVLVHCQAGVSRSATIVAAYLMYSRNMDAGRALELIQQARPQVSPNDGFLYQLDVFYHASFKISHRDKTTRMFYLERAVNEVMNGGGLPESTMFPRFPHTPPDSVPATPGGSVPLGPRRRIRCRQCRQELAAREHMLGHGNIGPSTPAGPLSFSPASSRRPSTLEPLVRRPSQGAADASRPRRPSALSQTTTGPAAMRLALGMTPAVAGQMSESPAGTPGVETVKEGAMEEDSEAEGVGEEKETEAATLGRQLSESLNMLEEEEEDDCAIAEDDDEEDLPPTSQVSGGASSDHPRVGSRRQSTNTPVPLYFDEAPRSRRPSAGAPAVPSKPPSRKGSQRAPHPFLPGLSMSTITPAATATGPPTGAAAGPGPAAGQTSAVTSPLAHGSDLAAQLFANPKLAALRSPTTLGGPGGALGRPVAPPAVVAPPILVDNKCSGYFLEPMKWMEPFLQDGQLAGKIVCPNKRCGAKLGNFDWAGVCCSCKEWVVPGFCVHRSKVDEFVV